jgi:hypothetical protein
MKIDLPEWLDKEDWDDFVADRAYRRIPISPVAAKRLIKKLGRLRDAGEDPAKVIDQSIQKGYRGVFPVHEWDDSFPVDDGAI